MRYACTVTSVKFEQYANTWSLLSDFFFYRILLDFIFRTVISYLLLIYFFNLCTFSLNK